MRVFKLDDGLVVRLPELLVEQMGITAGDEVNDGGLGGRRAADPGGEPLRHEFPQNAVAELVVGISLRIGADRRERGSSADLVQAAWLAVDAPAARAPFAASGTRVMP